MALYLHLNVDINGGNVIWEATFAKGLMPFSDQSAASIS